MLMNKLATAGLVMVLSGAGCGAVQKSTAEEQACRAAVTACDIATEDKSGVDVREWDHRCIQAPDSQKVAVVMIAEEFSLSCIAALRPCGDEAICAKAE